MDLSSQQWRTLLLAVGSQGLEQPPHAPQDPTVTPGIQKRTKDLDVQMIIPPQRNIQLQCLKTHTEKNKCNIFETRMKKSENKKLKFVMVDEAIFVEHKLFGVQCIKCNCPQKRSLKYSAMQTETWTFNNSSRLPVFSLADNDALLGSCETSNSNLSTDDENDNSREKESHICAVCLDVFFNPYMCYPCHHIFCEPCLRTLAKDNPSSTPCPLCRTTITKVLFQTALNKSTIAFFPNEYFKRKHSFQRTSCARWPLPCCEKVFRVFGGFSRLRDPFTRRQFPHSTHRLDSTDFEDNSHWWRFDVDVLIIYIFSVNWVIGFIIFCFLLYFFFPSF
ncbi:E3 ubiquitin-protein ligase RNF180 [Pleurodeles waltl]|uniref:E3 ubiquitin-protein ligase RNF180 n=1 Tax=Pleurodeles waltl TaxID=8319 RepID=UPI00370962BD